MDRRQSPRLLGRKQNLIHCERQAYPRLLLSFDATPSSPHPKCYQLPLITPSIDKLSTDITGDKNINAIQGGVAEGVGGTLSSGGILGGVGDLTSKEGVNRAERGDTGPLDKDKLGELQKKEQQQQKGWTETLSGGYLGGGKK